MDPSQCCEDEEEYRREKFRRIPRSRFTSASPCRIIYESHPHSGINSTARILGLLNLLHFHLNELQLGSKTLKIIGSFSNKSCANSLEHSSQSSLESVPSLQLYKTENQHTGMSTREHGTAHPMVKQKHISCLVSPGRHHKLLHRLYLK